MKFRRSRVRPLLPIAAAAVALAHVTLGSNHAAAQTTATASANATIQPNGPRAGTNGTNFFNVEGSANGTPAGSLADFGVLDFLSSAFNPGGQTANGIQGGTLSLSLTESNAAFTLPGNLEFYLTTVTGTSISNAAGASPLKYNGTSAGDSSTPTFGIDTGLGVVGGNAAGTLFDLGTGSFTTTGNTNTGRVDTFTLTLGSALNAFLTELNTAGGSLRLVVAMKDPTGAATFGGATNATAANRPSLSFTPTFAIGNPKYWQGGDNGSWTPTSTNFGASAGSPSGSATWDNGGTATAIFANAANTVNINAGNINAAGLEFDVNGYTINGTGTDNTLTLQNGHSINVVNAADTATVNAPIAGTVGLSKIGAGTLVLGGTNTFSGGVNVAAGTLQISADGNLGDAANGIALVTGSTLATTGNVTLGAGRTLSGSGALAVAAGNTLTFNGVVSATNLTLANGSTVMLANTDGTLANGASNGIAGLTFQTAGAALNTPLNNNPFVTSKYVGSLNSGGVSATQASGSVAVGANLNFTGTAATLNVANADATLVLDGNLTGGTLLTKTGAGTLVLNGDNSGLAGSGTPLATISQGSAGTNAVTGGTISIGTATALGTGQYRANGGTLRNNSGGALMLANSISAGARDSTATPGGAVFTGNNASATIEVAGDVSLFKLAGATIQHAMTFNTPTTFSGMFALSTGTGTSTGLTVGGTSTLTLAGAQANTFVEPVTVASGATLSLAKGGALGANTAVTLAAGATLRIDTGATADAINDAASLTLNGDTASGRFGQVVLSLTGTQEVVNSLTIGTSEQFMVNGTLVDLAGVLPAGHSYGAMNSGADYQDVGGNYFLGSGTLFATSVPEPGTWAMLIVGGMAVLLRLRSGAIGVARC